MGSALPPNGAYFAGVLARPGVTLNICAQAIRSAGLWVSRGQGSPVGAFNRKVNEFVAAMQKPLVVH